MKIMITGANGHLGRKLLAKLDRSDHEAVALVRSAPAADSLRDAAPGTDIHLVDYTDAGSLRAAGEGCNAVIHLVGIIRESGSNSFRMAHEDTCRALVDADLDVDRIICLGVLGTSEDSSNPCFRSRLAAERSLLACSIPAIIIRVPMVLGEGDHACISLAAKAGRRVCFSFRAGSLEQPVDSDDVVRALLAALELPAENAELDIAGQESLTRAALIRRAAACLGYRPPVVISLPLGLGMALAWFLEKLPGDAPVTRAMLGVLDHDDRVDAGVAMAKLGVTVTPLDRTLARVLPGGR